MKFQPTEIAGVFVVMSELSSDPRGTFVRIHSRQEFEAKGLGPLPEQCSLSYNCRRGTVRGLHYQEPPHAEAKLVCCVSGAAFDAVGDLRRKPSTYGRALWFSLVANRNNMIYVPEGCAHGFQTLEDDTTLLYMISASYQADAARGILWNDAALAIPWPEREAVVLSERDKLLPRLADVETPF